MASKEKTIMSFILKEEEYLPLKINAVENGKDISVLFYKLILNSSEYKNHYTPIKNIKIIPNLRQKRKVDGIRQVKLFADKIFHQKIKVMALINNINTAEMIRYLIVKYSPKLPSQNEN